MVFFMVQFQKVPEHHAGDSRERIRKFYFDYCFEASSDQNEVFSMIENEISTAICNRYHACVLAYGQSSTGKTYTMMGTPDNPGVTPKLCENIFSYLYSSVTEEESKEMQIFVSYLEIYNERVLDLLVPNSSAKSLKVREHPKKGPYVQGLTEHQVQTPKDLLSWLQIGNGNRRIAATSNNRRSSRSHCVFTVTTWSQAQRKGSSCKLHLVDLAGSERAHSIAPGANTPRLKEGANINRSLVALGNVICALSDQPTGKSGKSTRKRFVPYRDSVLTWLLKETLGGNSKTVMIATISPSSSCYNETVNTLRFGQRAKQIINQPLVNEDSQEKLIRELRAEISKLKELLKNGQGKDLQLGDFHVESIDMTEKFKSNESRPIDVKSSPDHKNPPSKEEVELQSFTEGETLTNTVLSSSEAPELIVDEIDAENEYILNYTEAFPLFEKDLEEGFVLETSFSKPLDNKQKTDTTLTATDAHISSSKSSVQTITTNLLNQVPESRENGNCIDSAQKIQFETDSSINCTDKSTNTTVLPKDTVKRKLTEGHEKSPINYDLTFPKSSTKSNCFSVQNISPNLAQNEKTNEHHQIHTNSPIKDISLFPENITIQEATDNKKSSIQNPSSNIKTSSSSLLQKNGKYEVKPNITLLPEAIRKLSEETRRRNPDTDSSSGIIPSAYLARPANIGIIPTSSIIPSSSFSSKGDKSLQVEVVHPDLKSLSSEASVQLNTLIASDLNEQISQAFKIKNIKKIPPKVILSSEVNNTEANERSASSLSNITESSILGSPLEVTHELQSVFEKPIYPSRIFLNIVESIAQNLDDSILTSSEEQSNKLQNEPQKCITTTNPPRINHCTQSEIRLDSLNVLDNFEELVHEIPGQTQTDTLIPVIDITSTIKPKLKLSRTNSTEYPRPFLRKEFGSQEKLPSLFSRRSSVLTPRSEKLSSISKHLTKSTTDLQLENSQSRSSSISESSGVSTPRKTFGITKRANPRRSEIVAAVTQRLYKKRENKQEEEVAKMEGNKLKILSARMRLQDITQKALRASRRKVHVEIQTEDQSTVRMKEKSTDVQDIAKVNLKVKDVFVEALAETKDNGISCQLQNSNLTLKLTGTSGTQTDEQIKPNQSVSFTKYLQSPPLRFPSYSQPIYTSSVNINVQHNYPRAKEDISDDSLEDSGAPTVHFSTPDLISNHNSLEQVNVTGKPQSSATEEKKLTMNIDKEKFIINECFATKNTEYCIAESSLVLPSVKQTLTEISIPVVRASETCAVDEFTESCCHLPLPKQPKAELANPVVTFEGCKQVSSAKTSVLKCPCKKEIPHYSSDEDESEEEEQEEECYVTKNNKNKKVRFVQRKQKDLLEVVTNFLDEASNLLFKLNTVATKVEIDKTTRYNRLPQYSRYSRLAKEKKECYVQTSSSSTHDAYSQTQIEESSIPSQQSVNNWDKVVIDSCTRLKECVEMAEEKLKRVEFQTKENASETVTDGNSNNHEDSDSDYLYMETTSTDWKFLPDGGDYSSLDTIKSTSDYGSLPRKNRNVRKNHYSPKAYMQQLVAMRKKIVEKSRNDILANDYMRLPSPELI